MQFGDFMFVMLVGFYLNMKIEGLKVRVEELEDDDG